MYKLLDFDPINKYGEPTIVNIGRADDTIKTAGLSSNAYAPEINSFIANLKPVIGKLYALINAMGATEYFSCNRNGDAFYEDALKKYHPTFVQNGHAFMHHKNKDPEKSYGKVVFSAYNDKMHRVELIVEYDIDKLDPKFAQKIDNGEMVNVSMGCKVDSDYCSICGNRAKSPAFYCEHLRDNPGLTKCLPDGRKAFAINRDPQFFDISIVTIPADPTARVMAKIASDHNLPVSSVQRAFEDDTFLRLARGEKMTKKAALKEAATVVVKKMPVNEEAKKINELTSDGCKELCDEFDRAIGPDIPKNILNLIGSLSDSPIKIFKSFITKKVFLRPQEAQRIALVSMGKPDLADALEKLKTVIMGDPFEGMQLFDTEDGCCPDSIAALPQSILSNREMSPVNIKKITIRVITSPEENQDSDIKLAGMGTIPVNISSDMQYLLTRREGMPPSQPGSGDFSLMDEIKTLGLMGAMIAALGVLSGGPALANPFFIAQMHKPSSMAVDQLSNITNEINAPVQEMQFLNPRSPEAIQSALMEAMQGINVNQNPPDFFANIGKQGSLKKGSFAELTSALPRIALTLPVAYGLSALIAKDAKEEALDEYQRTGKYEPGMLSRKSVTFPLAAAMLMKLSSVKKKAKTFMEKGAALKLPKSKLLANLEKLLYDKENVSCF